MLVMMLPYMLPASWTRQKAACHVCQLLDPLCRLAGSADSVWPNSFCFWVRQGGCTGCWLLATIWLQGVGAVRGCMPICAQALGACGDR